MATIRKRGSSWQAQVIRRGHRPEFKSFPTKAEAQAWARRIEADADSAAETLASARRPAQPMVRGAGWEFVFVAGDDHARIGFTDMYPDERTASAVQFLHNAFAYFASLGVRLNAVLTDNGSAFRSRDFRQNLSAAWPEAALHAGLPAADQRQGRTLHPVGVARVALRLHLPALRSTRRDAGPIHHYNQHRPHQGIGGAASMSRVNTSRNNHLTLYSHLSISPWDRDAPLATRRLFARLTLLPHAQMP